MLPCAAHMYQAPSNVLEPVLAPSAFAPPGPVSTVLGGTNVSRVLRRVSIEAGVLAS